jgi:SufS family cysteine desulfurase
VICNNLLDGERFIVKISSLIRITSPDMSLKTDFPFFSNNPELVYLDNAATTQKPKAVIDAISQYYSCNNANVHRGSFDKANELTEHYENVRRNVAKFIGAASKDNIVWTSGTTDSINLIQRSWASHNLKSGDTIVVLGSEHHANFVPWQQLALSNNLNFEVIPLSKDGFLDFELFTKVVALKPKLVAIQHCSNALGTIYPIKEMITLAQAQGAVVAVDGAQAVAHLPVNVEELGCDFYSFSAHKMYGPTGLGVLYAKDDIIPAMQPVKYGGEMVDSVSISATTFRKFPSNLETGTPNIAAIIGFDSAIQFISDKVMNNIKNEQKVFKHLVEALQSVPEVTLYGDLEQNVGIASFSVTDESIFDINTMLNESNVAVRAGSHCAMPLMAHLNVNGTIRASIGCYTDTKDIDNFISALKNAIELLKI